MVAAAVFSSCTNFDLLVEECVAGGRCGTNSSVTDAGVPSLSAEPSSFSFTLVSSEASVSRRVTISNRDGTAESLAFSFGGVNAADFKLTNQCSTTLSAGQSCDVDVSFAPSVPALGPREAVLEVRASTGAPLLIQLSGTVTATLETVAVLDFGDVATTTFSIRQLTIRNLSTKPVSVVPSVSAPFSVGVNECSAVGGMQTCRIDLRFDAPAPGERESTLLLGLTGSASSQSVTLRARSVTPGQLLLTPTNPFSTPGVAVERGSMRSIPIRLSNTGSQDIKSFELSLSAPTSWNLQFDAGCTSLPVDGGCDGTLRFAPLTIGVFPMDLVVDAGAIGNARLAGDGRGTGFSNVALNVTTGGPGIWVNQSLDGGRCYGSCAYDVWTDPYDASVVRFTAREHLLLNQAQWSSGGGCDGSVCDVLLASDSVQLSVVIQPRPIAFISSQLTSASLGGIAGADALCAARAAAVGLPGEFAALLSNVDGGPGLSRFLAGATYSTTDGGTFVLRTDAGMNIGTELGTAPPPGDLVWTGFGGGATCTDWSQGCCGGGGASNVTVGPWTHTSFNCNNAARLLCLSNGTVRQIPTGAWTIVAVRTSGLGVNFQSECEGASILGLKDIRPFVARPPRPICRSFDLPDGGLGPAFSGPLYRADGEQVLDDARELQSCTTTVPLLKAAVAWSIEAGALERSTVTVVRTGARWPSDTVGTACNNFTTTSTGSFFTGDLRRRDIGWLSDSVNAGCNVTSHIYCVGRR